ncbi:hypothetical protein HK17_02990 [Acetobacter indonesiensis]|uniref:Uncharacterized protein n=1 Tax=Acetobacter indonesiensis TaxID=104101 RepID=A0A252AVV2_9PROT|nr:hypothetical protein HK17_02990 [Acetobacter indonesiensis]
MEKHFLTLVSITYFHSFQQKFSSRNSLSNMKLYHNYYKVYFFVFLCFYLFLLCPQEFHLDKLMNQALLFQKRFFCRILLFENFL